ncbi:DNA methyltransferase [Aminivibrio sp.]|uniref:DNA methyltransferase n=1 Tax=Aminivibrio sp. TaxID=1872489 RepID=UPI001A405624|nr:DNA methyltransferase [Aminivibrio sp.]MBL3539581.1 hypothetical protein [Aminivibrio sp.]
MSRKELPGFNQEPETRHQKPVECLGMTFPNDEERRKHFLGILREKLKDPEFRKIEGFPHGSDKDILALSAPPYYTACPNPFIADFIKHYGKPYDPATDNYRREPFASDTGAGKTHPIYTAHSYHSKIPHLATMPCILHYTEPGDIVFDGFSGSGMTGVAAQLCGQPEAEFKATLEAEWKKRVMHHPSGDHGGLSSSTFHLLPISLPITSIWMFQPASSRKLLIISSRRSSRNSAGCTRPCTQTASVRAVSTMWSGPKSSPALTAPKRSPVTPPAGVRI